MDPNDLIVLIAEQLELPQAIDLLMWYVRAEPITITSPSLRWWCLKHAKEVKQYTERKR